MKPDDTTDPAEEIGDLRAQLTDDELREMLTNILVLIRATSEPSEGDEVRSVVEGVVAQRARVIERAEP